MKDEDKELLLKDLSSRLSYDCKVALFRGGIDGLQWNNVTLNSYLFYEIEEEDSLKYIKPYLRPMSSMTEEERDELRKLCRKEEGILYDIGISGAINAPVIIDYFNSHHFDFRGLIPMGLALEAPKYMYKEE